MSMSKRLRTIADEACGVLELIELAREAEQILTRMAHEGRLSTDEERILVLLRLNLDSLDMSE